MRIALTSHVADYGGAEIAMLDAADEMARRGIDVTLILMSDGPLLAAAEARGVKTVVTPLGEAAHSIRRHGTGAAAAAGAWASMGGVVRLAQVLRRHRIDLLETNSLKTHLIGAAAGRFAATSTVWRLRDIASPPHVSRRDAYVIQQAGRFASAVVAVSKAAAASVRHPRKWVEPSAIQFSRFSDVPSLPEFLQPPLRIASISRLAHWKGQDVLLDAVHVLHREGVAVSTVVAGGALFGESQYEEELRAAAPRETTFLGHVVDVRPVLERCHIVVHTPRLPEPFGKVVVEAMAAGRVVLGPAAGGPAEILAGHLAGWLFESSAPATVADKLRHVIDNWPAYAAETSLARGLAERYDIAPSVSRCLCIYRKIVEEVR